MYNAHKYSLLQLIDKDWTFDNIGKWFGIKSINNQFIYKSVFLYFKPKLQ